jgi:hypothetical protein
MHQAKGNDKAFMGPVSGPGVEDGPVLINFIPTAYNDASTLTRLIEPPGGRHRRCRSRRRTLRPNGFTAARPPAPGFPKKPGAEATGHA